MGLTFFLAASEPFLFTHFIFGFIMLVHSQILNEQPKLSPHIKLFYKFPKYAVVRGMTILG
jgi:hypothetical protein